MNFQSEVIKKSQDIPVLVDFWAPWCGPCQFLGPVLDQLALEQKDKWVLVKVNVDENQEVSSNYGIKGIPAVKLFHKGEIIGEFSGALPQTAIKKWLIENLPDRRKDELNQIINNTNDIPNQDTIDKLETFMDKNPGYQESKILLARHLVFTDVEKAGHLVEDISMGNEYYDLAQHIRTLIKFVTTSYEPNTEIGQIMNSAKLMFQKNNIEESIKLIIEANRINMHYLNDLPRLTAIAIFETLGRHHSLSKSYRRKFDMVLY